MGASVIFGITCVILPVIAWLVINQTWELYIPGLNVMYRPWRLFLVVCGLPSLVCALALLKVPESPKFVLSQGRQDETVEILQRIYRANVGGTVADREPLKIGTIIEEIESVAQRQRCADECKNGGNGATAVARAMWNQTAPLFRQPHLKRTFIACAMQFGIYVTSNGMYMWFPEILNRMADFMERNPGKSMSLCGILEMTHTNLTALSDINETQINEVCTTQLEIATFEHSIVLELLYAIGFAFIGLIINRIGKFPILCKYRVVSSIFFR